jgi:hypothetical protein
MGAGSDDRLPKKKVMKKDASVKTINGIGPFKTMIGTQRNHNI